MLAGYGDDDAETLKSVWGLAKTHQAEPSSHVLF